MVEVFGLKRNREASPNIFEVDPILRNFKTVKDHAGINRSWHYLDNLALLKQNSITPTHTLLAIHGNPTYSFLYRSLFNDELLQRGWRVIAVDQLEMGYSERSQTKRSLPDRITDLGLLTDVLEINTPVVTVGHDWGGIVSIGWALAHQSQLEGVILTNTAIYQELGQSLPKALQLATAPGIRKLCTSTTDAFIRTTLGLSKPSLPKAIQEAYLAPYKTIERRLGVEQFVADIPNTPAHPSRPTLERLAHEITQLKVPTLLAWGPRDVVFQDRYLKDLISRLPHADVHRFENASHLVWEDAPVSDLVSKWLKQRIESEQSAQFQPVSSFAKPVEFKQLGHKVTELANRNSTKHEAALVEILSSGIRRITWSHLEQKINDLAYGLKAQGVKAGSRVSVLVTPGADLTAIIYACMRLGAVIVLADAGLGIKGLTRAVVSSHPDFIIGIPTALSAAKLFNWPGEKISVRTLGPIERAVLKVTTSIDELFVAGKQIRDLGGSEEFEAVDPDDDVLILFTSGSTGPAKGAVLTHRQASAMFEAVGKTLMLKPERGLVAGFAPFALLGPALGAPSIVPEMDVTKPGELTASALADAVEELGSPAVFTAPAALKNILDTQSALTDTQRAALKRVTSFFSAGAPIPAHLLRELKELMPTAKSYSPYGMTEALAVAAIDLEGIESAGEGNGVPVGTAVANVEIAIAALGADGQTTGQVTTEPGVSGEILVKAAHVRDRYLNLWDTTTESMRFEGYHATGDVGHLDERGVLWVEGRMAHIAITAQGPITPVQIEKAAEQLSEVRRAGMCAVGPKGVQQIVVVVEQPETFKPGKATTPTPASPELQAKVRTAVKAATNFEVTAVFTTRTLPTDIRHNSKIDRARLSAWAEAELAGEGAKL